MIKPTKGKVLIEVMSNEEISPGGIIIAEGVKKVPRMRGKIIAVGGSTYDRKGKKQTFIGKPGDIAHYKKASGVKWRPLGGKHYLFLKFGDIVGVES